MQLPTRCKEQCPAVPGGLQAASAGGPSALACILKCSARAHAWQCVESSCVKPNQTIVCQGHVGLPSAALFGDPRRVASEPKRARNVLHASKRCWPQCLRGDACPCPRRRTWTLRPPAMLHRRLPHHAMHAELAAKVCLVGLVSLARRAFENRPSAAVDAARARSVGNHVLTTTKD